MNANPLQQTQNELNAALGPLAPLFNDPSVVVIMVDAPDRILFQREGDLYTAENVGFASAEAIQQVVDNLVALCGVAPTPEQTIINMRFPGGDAHAVAVLPPTALNNPLLAIRRLIIPSFDWNKLIEYGSVTRESLDLLMSAIHAHVNILVAGGTASGKTTVATMLAESIPAQERLVVVEGFHEISVRHPRAVCLEAGRTASVDEVVRTGSIMRPDWLIIGELAGAEAMTAVEILGHGHCGLTTIHASSVEDALSRLEIMCLKANLGLGLGQIREMIVAAIRLVTFQQRMPAGNRKMTQISELLGLENDRYVLQPLFRYNDETEHLESTGIQPSWRM